MLFYVLVVAVVLASDQKAVEVPSEWDRCVAANPEAAKKEEIGAPLVVRLNKLEKARHFKAACEFGRSAMLPHYEDMMQFYSKEKACRGFGDAYRIFYPEMKRMIAADCEKAGSSRR